MISTKSEKLHCLKLVFRCFFINDFPNLNVEVLEEESPKSMEVVHELNVYILLYKIYVLLRSNKYGLIKNEMNLIEIYKVFYDWLLTTDYFDSMDSNNKIIEEIDYTQSQLDTITSADFKKKNPNRDFINKDEYLLYFSSLVSLVSKKSNIPIAAKRNLLARQIENLPVILNLEFLNFPKNSIHPKILQIVKENSKKNALSQFSSEILGMSFDSVLTACTKTETINGIQVSRYVFGQNCIKPIYVEWFKLFNKYLASLTENEDINHYLNMIESTIKSIPEKSKRELLEYIIITYFRLLSQKQDSELKPYERRMCRAFLIKAISVMARNIDSDKIKGFTNFIVGTSSLSTFGKYFYFLNDEESEFHGYKIYYIILCSQILKAKKYKMLNNDTEFGKVMEYKKELTNTFEKRYPGLQKKYSKDVQKKPFRFIKSIYKTEFFLNFLDFFNLFFPMTKQHKLHNWQFIQTKTFQFILFLSTFIIFCFL